MSSTFAAVGSSVDLRGLRVLVVGMARSGVAAAELAVRRGALVTCTDLRPDAPVVAGSEPVYGAHRRDDFLGADLIVVSPGVPARQPDLAAAIAAGVEVVGELAFAASMLTAPILAVSGTNGKSTTTHLLGQLCERAGLRTFTGGNLGQPLSTAVDEDLDVCVVEVSSYQLELPGGQGGLAGARPNRIRAFRPHAAAILNLTPDHLDRHGTMDSYGAHKCRLFAKMGPGDYAIVPCDDARLIRLAALLPGRRLWLGGSPGVTVLPDRLVLDAVQDPGEVSLEGFDLPGAHNRQNLACAVLLAVCGGMFRRDLHVAGLEGLPHRMERVAVRRGVTWIDDSKATNVEAALAAVRDTGPATWVLLGGRGKEGAAYEALAEPLRRVRGIVCFGEAGPLIADVLEASGLSPRTVATLDDAVAFLAAEAGEGETVLLSPACASFDAFTDFEHRGRHFRDQVRGLPT
ncbi:MAG: UDP-N-acetylmuramoyl-L-alanine--D-glutamate ligase [Pseudomonadota bacterium]|nr:UDP-N-acetylmuramoyl-L-alanine--D-glutamate ligase [Pseudomonadota bacterium]